MSQYSQAHKQTAAELKVRDELMKVHQTTSQAIRFLNAEGKTRSEISKILNVRYQHVRNVLITPIKKPSVK